MSLPRISAPGSATKVSGFLTVTASRYIQGGTFTTDPAPALSTRDWRDTLQGACGPAGSPRSAAKTLGFISLQRVSAGITTSTVKIRPSSAVAPALGVPRNFALVML